MRLSEFVMIRCTGDGCHNLQYVAEVNCTTGVWLWKKTVRREIRRDYGSYWFFVDTGEYCIGLGTDALERAWNAQHGEFNIGKQGSIASGYAASNLAGAIRAMKTNADKAGG
jgi:hypothetical protein